MTPARIRLIHPDCDHLQRGHSMENDLVNPAVTALGMEGETSFAAEGIIIISVCATVAERQDCGNHWEGEDIAAWVLQGLMS